MKKYFKFLILIGLLFLSSQQGYSQKKDLEKEISALRSKYNNVANLSYHYTSAYYIDNSNIKPDLVLSGDTKLKGRMIKTHFDSAIYIVNQNYKVVIDDASETIALDTNISGNDTYQLPLDSLLDGTKITSKKVDGSFIVYTFTMKEGASINNYELQVNINSGYIDKVTLNYNPMIDDDETAVYPKVITTINAYSVTPISDLEFGITKYFGLDGGELVPIGIYENYEFINNLNNEELQ